VHASPEVEAAVDKIIATGLIPPKVAPEFGVSHSSIYRNPRYKAWKAAGSVKIAKRTSKRSESHQDTNAGVVPEVTTQVEGIADAA
jgi:transposase